MFRFSTILVASAVVLTAPVHAQSMYYPDMMGMGIDRSTQMFQHDSMMNMLENAGSASDDDGNPSESNSTTTPQFNPSQLAYKPSSARRQANLRRFASGLRQRDPQGAAAFENVISSTDVITAIGQSMRPTGLSVNNTADAFAVYWIAAWEAVHNRDMGASPQMYQAVRDQAANLLGPVRQLTSASDAGKQEFAESLLVQAALITAGKDKWGGNRTEQAALAKAVKQGAQRIGLDLTKMTLTQDGFVPRSGGRSDASDAAGDDSQLAANDGAQADGTGIGDYALYAVAGTGLLAGMFALDKGFSKKG